MKLDINFSCLFFHSLRNFGLSGSLLFIRKKYVSLYLREMCPLLPTVEFGPSCASPSSPPTPHNLCTQAELILHDGEINLEIQH